jgi:hypothetical protein
MKPPTMARYTAPRAANGHAANIAAGLTWNDCLHPDLPPPGEPVDDIDHDEFPVDDEPYDLHDRE